MQNIESRLERLQRSVEGRTGPQTTFEIEGGDVFRTSEDPLAYIHERRLRTPDGRRIVGWKRPEGRHDPLSQSLIDLIDEAIERGAFPWSEV